ncbi:hypothetical protein QUC31_020799 [Theobroma cacao]
MRRGTQTSQHIYPHAFELRREIMLSSASAGSILPLSKTVRFNVLKVIPAGSSGGGKKAFTGI